MHVFCSNYDVFRIVTCRARVNDGERSDNARLMLTFTSLPRGLARRKDSQTACTTWTAVSSGRRRAGTKETEAKNGRDVTTTGFKVLRLG